MSDPVYVHMIGAPIACAEGVKDTWREIADWAAGQLAHRFGPTVRVRYYDLFDADCPPLPAEAQLPLVLVDDQIVTSGGKISVPAIRRHLEAMGVTPVAHRV